MSAARRRELEVTGAVEPPRIAVEIPDQSPALASLPPCLCALALRHSRFCWAWRQVAQQ
jgi:hypothetical protein